MGRARDKRLCVSTLTIGADDLIDLQTHTIHSDGHW